MPDPVPQGRADHNSDDAPILLSQAGDHRIDWLGDHEKHPSSIFQAPSPPKTGVLARFSGDSFAGLDV